MRKVMIILVPQWSDWQISRFVFELFWNWEDINPALMIISTASLWLHSFWDYHALGLSRHSGHLQKVTLFCHHPSESAVRSLW
jgi:hypothetical protein